ncbi:hypothetical protein DCO59_04015 [Helicobacter saguini]|uniref:hypothetical protein n=1 Tax=Helicobacter saguini TaxID=1548018 RepID=UPI001370B85D|nr:hypothetical protein [Helicobacter saguini]MWV71538.1 hypothetical protein [Helicobacter saguini]
MIRSILINNGNGFNRVNVRVSEGFNVVSGVSGAGKSVFFNLILSAFGLKDALAELVELNIELPLESNNIESNGKKDSKKVIESKTLKEKSYSERAESSSKNTKDSKEKLGNIESNTTHIERSETSKNKSSISKISKDSIESKNMDIWLNMGEDSKNLANIFENYGILLDENIANFSVLKKNSTRYFINNQNISKKKLSELSSNFVKYISIKDASELESENILHILDSAIMLQNATFSVSLSEYKSNFLEYKAVKAELDSIIEKQKNLANLKEFAEFEIDKIKKINPQIGEYDKLLMDKKNLSKKEKVLQSCQKALDFLDNFESVNKALELLNIDNSVFSSVMLDVRASLENALSEFENLDIEPEMLLDRISALADIIRRYGSESEALETLKKQEKFLSECENIEFDMTNLEKKCNDLKYNLNKLCEKITQFRLDSIPFLAKELCYFSHKLRLGDITLNLTKAEMSESGGDKIEILLDSKSKNVLSAGEYNRVRLAVLCSMVSVENMEFSSLGNNNKIIESKTKKAKSSKNAKMKDSKVIESTNIKDSKADCHEFANANSRNDKKIGILILDEIDANLSGEESEGVAELLAFLSQKYQIFAISHQPFMPIFADSHFLITKDSKNNAEIKLLDNENKIKEIARMISGSHLDSNAINYVTKLLEKHKQRI